MKNSERSLIDGLTDQEQKEAWEKLYAKDLPIIGGFLKNIRQKADKHFRLHFNDNTQLIACFITCADSDNGLDLNDPNYEEFYEFYFKVKRIEKKGSELNYKENEGIALNYHNFFIKFEPYESEI